MGFYFTSLQTFEYIPCFSVLWMLVFFWGGREP